MTTDFSFVLKKFKNLKETKHNQFMATCPAHNDRHPSLSLKINGNRLLINCLAGCAKKSILQAVGLTESDLYINDESNQGQKFIKSKERYSYVDENGAPLYFKERFDYSDGSKSFAFYEPDGQKGLNDVKRVPYNLSGVIEASTVYFVEGEKCAQALIDVGLAATSLDSGANSKWDDTFTQYFEDKKVLLVPDNDKPGFNYALRVLDNLPDAKVIILPNLKEKQDVYDWINQGHTAKELDSLPLLTKEEFQKQTGYIGSEQNEEFTTEATTQAQKLIRLIDGFDPHFFHDELKRPFARIKVKKHFEIYLVNGHDFRLWLSKIFWDEYKSIINRKTLVEVQDFLTAKALFDGERYKLENRIARYEKSIFYDLSNDEWQAVRITDSGWEICDTPPILFERIDIEKPQVIPEHCDFDLFDIFSFINLGKNQQLLFLVWLISSFWPDIPHTMAVFFGDAGAAKTTALNMIMQIIDPSSSNVLTFSKKKGDLILSFLKHYYLPFDNLSKISDEESDDLCRAITGASIELRKLYTNSETVSVSFRRVLSLNGVSNIADKPDLIDRSIFFEVERISEENRRTEGEIYPSFYKVLPALLGAIFSVLSKAMKIYPTIKLEKLPRMADFTCVGFAIAEAIGNYGAKFLEDYAYNRQQQDIEILNDSPLGTAVYQYMQKNKEWTGTATDFLKIITNFASSAGLDTSDPEFPKHPNSLSSTLHKLSSTLRNLGICFKKGRNKSQRRITLSRINK